MKLTFVDAGVLSAAARGSDDVARRAMEVLDDPDREFASSRFIRLEVLPKALYQRNADEAEFYNTFFESVRQWAEPVDRVVEVAYEEAVKSGLSAMDALHIAAATMVKAAELLTTERPGKPIHRVTSVVVWTIHPEGQEPTQ